MDIAPPVTVPGTDLAKKRKAYGVTAVALAAKLRHDRGTVKAWEEDPEVDVRRQRLYMAALNECVREMP